MSDIIHEWYLDWATLVIVVISAFLWGTSHISNSILIPSDNQKLLENMMYRDITLRLLCISDTYFITDSSEISCSIAAKSEYWNYTDTRIIVQAFKIDQNRTHAFWACAVYFSFISNATYTNDEKCATANEKPITTNIPTNIEFRLYDSHSRKAELENITLVDNGFTATDDDQRPFSPIVRVLPKEVESNAIATNVAQVIAFNSLIIVITGLFVSITSPFIIHNREVYVSKKERLNKQINILRALAIELRRIKMDSNHFDSIFNINKKSSINLNKQHILRVPQVSIKYLNSAFYIRSLDNEIKSKNTGNLKDLLVDISDRISLFNNSLRRIKDRYATWPEIVMHYMRLDKRFEREVKEHPKVSLDKSLEDALDILEREFEISAK